jgi:alkanesulfonate monooxygenase SsuD/methylene tetrahydromethanopterin reductase-like flavin-dependent oxidoreductase (luciferase family)
VAARAVQTLDVVSNGRAEVGIGAGWLREEWLAAGLDPATRGRRLDEALGVVKRLWTEPAVEHHGEFYDFAPVAFEPKPVQKPWPRIHVGGESDAALRRAARHGDGWLGLGHTPESVAAPLARLRSLREREERAHEPFEITIGASPASKEDAARLAEAGVHRILMSPWQRSREAVDGLRRAAERLLG